MSYFEVYLKRINRYGNSLQERIQNKREHDFLTFMEKSPNLVRARNGEDKIEYNAILQTQEYDQDEIVDYLLVPLDNIIPMGTVIHTIDQRHKKIQGEEEISIEKNWINYAIDPYTSTGYNRYTIVELESEISWVYEGIKYTSLAHATGGGSGARDKNINLKFNTQFSESGVYLPNKRYSIIMPYNEHIKKNIKVTLGNETWRVAGFDNISVKGVSYITLEEYLHDNYEDIPVVNTNEFLNWSITTSKGKNFIVSNSEPITLNLFFYYKEKLNEEVKYKILNSNDYEIQNLTEKEITITAKNNFIGQTSLKIVIEGWEDEKYYEIPFSFSARAIENIYISGPNFIYVNTVVAFKIYNATEEEFNSISLIGNCAEIEKLSYETKEIFIKGISIGKSSLNIPDLSNSTNISFDFEVKSIWLSGES